ncbi:hypothetical protein KVR01_007336 [Diaporthe batatas]|uniref:uncharacterized protein n=1 Tax=Diaporthe batatas TaxID=748121 RepID=UPI001D04F60B|nr:uncharacterized protein KVR01_007336 [Diaporthe batatas]KAG8162858.1 hypothetical protein KVR01_007336 [Diaporthe batatas]
MAHIRFASSDKEEWYDWYKRLGAHPEASEKELKKAYYKRAKVEHSDIDKTPGAKARFQNLRDTYENLCDPSKRKTHDQERLDRHKAAAAETARMMASRPSVADALKAKWEAEEEYLRKLEEFRKRETRKDTQPASPQTSPHRQQKQDANKPRESPQKPQDTKTQRSKEAAPKGRQRQAEPERTEESRRREQKMAEEELAKRKAVAKQKRLKEDAARKKAEENERLQERILVIRSLPPGTKLEDVFDPLIKLAPGPVFRATLWSNNMVEIEFCTEAAARVIFYLAKKDQLYIRDRSVINFELTRSKNELPVISNKSRVLVLRKKGFEGITLKNESLRSFFTRFNLQVERIVEHPPAAWSSVTVRLASWADAERAMRLLAKSQPHVNVQYGPDPCGMKDNMARSKVKLSGSEDTEQEETKSLDSVGDLVSNLFFIGLLLLMVAFF